MLPVIALVGRPNVGKSTLFNYLTRSREALVADYPGLTRDRHYGNARLGKHEFIVIDTGGFEPDASSGIYKEMARQTQQAVAEADIVVFVVDARDGLSAQDHDIANYLRRLGKPCLLVANKAEGMREGTQLAEFYELGLGEVLPVSAAHGQGVRDMLEEALYALNLPDEEEETEEDPSVIKLAVAGRPANPLRPQLPARQQRRAATIWTMGPARIPPRIWMPCPMPCRCFSIARIRARHHRRQTPAFRPGWPGRWGPIRKALD